MSFSRQRPQFHLPGVELEPRKLPVQNVCSRRRRVAGYLATLVLATGLLMVAATSTSPSTGADRSLLETDPLPAGTTDGLTRGTEELGTVFEDSEGEVVQETSVRASRKPTRRVARRRRGLYGLAALLLVTLAAAAPYLRKSEARQEERKSEARQEEVLASSPSLSPSAILPPSPEPATTRSR
ncbi:hypothetical protein CSUI_002358 [Cystoisospora suis]|uniref:Transmembrane protein n=1 Tax=Cystoisospora suis TaxID=483139 RepID=A0A2C6L9N7_9APIC|nr:hypothetical protein CSUI_002358 [Cystoisospora suis]